MKSTREQFEEIWPVPEGVEWGSITCGYFAHYHMAQELAVAHNARLDTFTRCQETTAIYVGIVDELIGEMELVLKCSNDLGIVGIARESIGRAKQKLEQIK